MPDSVGDHRSFKLFHILISREYIGLERRRKQEANLGRRKDDAWFPSEECTEGDVPPIQAKPGQIPLRRRDEGFSDN
jgi:hypothetical protein